MRNDATGTDVGTVVGASVVVGRVVVVAGVVVEVTSAGADGADVVELLVGATSAGSDEAFEHF